MSALACLSSHPHWSSPRIFLAIGTPAPEGGEGALRAAADVWQGTPGIPEIVVGGPSEDPLTVLVTAGDVGAWLASTTLAEGPDRVIIRAEVTVTDDPATWAQGYDPVTVLVHELGSVVGLADVDRPGDAMHWEIAPGELRREITDGDLEQIAHLDDEECVGCSVGHGGTPALGAVLLAMVAIAVVRRVL